MLTIPCYWYLVPVAALVALAMAFFFYRFMKRQPDGNKKMKAIAHFVRVGAFAYLRRQYKTVSIVFAVLFVVFVVLAVMGIQNPFVPVAFLTGGFFSGLCGFLGMKTATYASSRTANGAISSLNRGLVIAFRSGAVMGLVVVGFGLLDISAWFFALNYIYDHNVWNFGADVAAKLSLGAWSTDMVNNAEWAHAKMVEITTTMLTFGMGASLQALFARVGGGIYTKAADVGADLVGKVEAGIPEDDPRNPATIADNVGDNVGDVAGMGADLYESYCGSILSTAALGAALPMGGMKLVIAPMVVAAIGIVLSLVGIFAVRTKETADTKSLLRSLLTGTLGSSVLILVALLVLVKFDFISMGIFGSVLSGLAAGILIGQFTEYYTSDAYKPTRGIAGQAKLGAATTIIDGISVGMFSTGLPVVTIVVGIIFSFGCSGGFDNMAMGLYGVGFAAVGMLSTLGITLATDAFGPIADNAGGNAEMAGLDPEVRARTDELDMLGNTTAATGKGFAIGSAALTAMALLASYVEEVKIWLGHLATSAEGVWKVGSVAFANGANELANALSGVAGVKFLDGGTRAITENGDLLGMVASKVNYADFMQIYNLNLMNPMLLGGLFIGAMMTFVFCALTIKAVGRAASAMVEEVRRQFREIPGIMEGTAEPNYARCVDISTTGAQHEMIVPSILAVIVPVLVGLFMGVAGVFGLLAGGLASGFALATMLNNSGGAWDNAKKFVEKGNYGGKGSDTHKAAVVGDTVGDPFKDTAGPSLNILIKLMTMVSVVFAGVIVRFGDMFF
ncbi:MULTISPECIES: sodium-translocating pyrophosphatase [unclassified Fibrobacter]|uniref:sodium-translocating pyrophosphatase n=1 Tax=unclassified Fibrobacter TaxID=2634177 RepID=UPI0025BCA2B3|nr:MULTISPECIES: sodium-translocating pyrophosphatase [unclassified Fibrobacter]